MKKNLFILLAIFLITAFLFSAETKANKVIISTGEDKVQDLINSQNISVFITFEGTKIMNANGSFTLDECVTQKLIFAKDREKIITNFLKNFDNRAKFIGKQWNLTRVTKPEDAKEGYLIFFNYDLAIPISNIGCQGNATIKIVKADNQSEVLITGRVYSFAGASPGLWDSIYAGSLFSEVGLRFVTELVQFFKGNN